MWSRVLLTNGMTHRGPRSGMRDSASSDVVSWRGRCLERAGFRPALAEELAGDVRVDLHAVLELVDRGCAPELAARIVAPLDDEQDGAA
jgi:hypothetical protein